MPRLKAANNALDTLAADITAAATSLTVHDATGFPAAPFRISIGYEILEVTVKSGTTFTVTRGVEGTTPVAHAHNSRIEVRWTAGMYDYLGTMQVVNVKEYGAVGNGVVDDTAAIQTAIDAAELTGSVVIFPRGTYATTAQLNVNASNVHLLSLEGAVIQLTIAGSAIAISVRGTGVAAVGTLLTVAVQEGDQTVVVADETGLAVGDFVMLKDGAAPWLGGSDGAYCGEIHCITAINAGTNTLTFECGIYDDYAVGTAAVHKITLLTDCSVEGLTVQLGASKLYTGIEMAWVYDARVSRCTVRNGGYTGIGTTGLYFFALEDNVIEEGFLTGYGYAIQVNGSQHGVIQRNQSRNNRVAVDLSGAWPTRFVDVAHNVSNTVNLTEARHYGTHNAAQYVSFSDNEGIGGIETFVLRGCDIEVIGNRGYQPTSYFVRSVAGYNHKASGNLLSSYQPWATANKKPTQSFWAIQTTDATATTYFICTENNALVSNYFMYINENITNLDLHGNYIRQLLADVGPFFVWVEGGNTLTNLQAYGNTVPSNMTISGTVTYKDFDLRQDLPVGFGGFKQSFSFFYDVVDANLTNADAQVGGALREFIVNYAGSILAIGVVSDQARTAGTLTAEVTKNGVGIGLAAILDGTNALKKVTTQAKDTDTFVAGDLIGVHLTTSADWTPVTANIRVVVAVEM